MSASATQDLPPPGRLPPDSSLTKKRKVGSKACDACKIRKVRCSGMPPCERCTTNNLPCTFNRPQAIRGPRSLRTKTLEQIHSVQQSEPISSEEESAPQPLGITPSTTTATGSSGPFPDVSGPSFASLPSDPSPTTNTTNTTTPNRTPIETLVLRLCIYRLRLFPVWPIVAVESVLAPLQANPLSPTPYALANAIGAATMAQLKLSRTTSPEITDSVTAADMAAESRRVRGDLDNQEGRGTLGGEAEALDRLRTAFFMHVYYENLRPGGPRSVLALREAITLAQLMRLDRPGSYVGLPAAESLMRRRILWHLFVTERGVALLHKLPVILTNPRGFPPLSVTASPVCGRQGPVGHGVEHGVVAGLEEQNTADVLPAFRQLVNLFWIFDQSGALEILQSLEDGDARFEEIGRRDAVGVLRSLQRHLRDAPANREVIGNDVQRADLFVTRQWMQILLWRALLARRPRDDSGLSPSSSSSASSSSVVSAGSSSSGNSGVSPVQIARELLELIGSVPRTALEAHGPGLEYKVYEISRAVADALAGRVAGGNGSMGGEGGNGAVTRIADGGADRGPLEVLMGLQRVLASCRGGNWDLLDMLRMQMSRTIQVFATESSSSFLGAVSSISSVPDATEGLRIARAGPFGSVGQNVGSLVNSVGWEEAAVAAVAMENIAPDLLGFGDWWWTRSSTGSASVPSAPYPPDSTNPVNPETTENNTQIGR